MSVKKIFIVLSLCAIAAFLLTSCRTGSDETPPALEETLTGDALGDHLQNLSGIADTNAGTRAAGTAGYDASADYIKGVMESAGFLVTEQEVAFRFFQEVSDPVLEQTSPAQESYTVGEDFLTMTYSGAGDVTAEIVFVSPQFPPGADPNTSDDGCEAADFESIELDGKIAVIQRGSCDFQTKVLNAQDNGAAAVLIFNEGQAGRTAYTPGNLGDDADIAIPVMGLSYEAAEALYTMAQDGAVSLHVAVDTDDRQASASNLIAETDRGNEDQVVMLGAHLDSAMAGAGINNNGTGASALLEIAYQIAVNDYDYANKVRFAWWAGGEQGLVGSAYYTETLSGEAAAKIAMYLNADTIGSENSMFMVYDGDLSDTADNLSGITDDPDEIPAGSAEIEAAFADYFDAQGIVAEPAVLDGKTDYYPFLFLDVPFGGLCTENTETVSQDVFLTNAKALAHVTEQFADTEILFSGAKKRSARTFTTEGAVAYDNAHKDRHLRAVK